MTISSVPELRGYQIDAQNAVCNVWANGNNRSLVHMATGLGKTTVFASLRSHPSIARWLGSFPEGQRTMLVIAHRKELIDQAASRLQLMNPGALVSVEQGDRYANPYSDIVVASIQTLSDMKGRRLKRLLQRTRFRIVIIDEAHHASAATYRNLLVALQFLPPADATEKENTEAADFEDVKEMEAALTGWDEQAPKDQLLIGFTATTNRSDAIGLGCVFQSIAYSYGIKPAIEAGWLSPIVPWVIETQTSLDDVRTTHGEFNQKDLAEAVNKEQRNALAVAAWREHANGLSTIAFTVDVAHAYAMAEIFRKNGVSAVAVSGETPKEERAQAFQDYLEGRVKVLSNCMIITEGVDLPLTQCILNAKPTKSATLYCLDSETEILTPDGWVRYDHIGVNSEVAGYDYRTGLMQWEYVSGYVARPMLPDETMLAVRSPSVNLRLTDTHRIVARWRSTNHELTKWSVMPAGLLRGEHEIPVAGIQQAKGLELSDADLEFIAWVQTDGVVNKANGSVHICQSSSSPHCGDIERVLTACGFKWRMSESSAPTNFGPRRTPLRVYRVSKGAPRGTDKHLSGWGRLEPFLPKAVGRPAYLRLEEMTEAQFDVFLSAVHAGDGSKQVGQSWTRRSYHIASADSAWTDWLQSMCVRRRWRCHVSQATRTLSMLHCSKGVARRIGHVDRGQEWRRVPHASDEVVWCVSVPSGAIVVRRHGKAAIVGNTQMVGRGLRPYPNKLHCIVIDLVDVARKHSLQAAPVLYGLPPGIKANGDDLRKIEGDLDAFKEMYPQFNVEQALASGHLTLQQLAAYAKTFDIWSVPELGPVGAGLALNWIRTGTDLFRLQYPIGDDATEILTVQKDMLGHFDVVCTVRQRPPAGGPYLNARRHPDQHVDVPHVRQRTIAAQIPTASAALLLAEQYVENERGTVTKLKDKSAPWRQKKASPKQLALLRKIQAPFNERTITAGEASDKIDLYMSRRAR